MAARTRTDIEHSAPGLSQRSDVQCLQRALYRKEPAASDRVGNSITARDFDGPSGPAFEMIEERAAQGFVMLHRAQPPEPASGPLEGMSHGEADIRAVPAAHD